ncbi:hypothetical protein CYMTET_42860 [Cymbomonas tetramitiformis]|uniref:Beta-lactamase-related domain-containing protein n=1 Tax=Cymbomonas tetramitiformis TaxID=36881 RepID=A0AAE0EMS8_9CHLO|nr:hypothetical protein CYMTET_56212 [Cymbomonas tetramitiformis]KAK3247651.1 hypothetical protein CYMTET_42860 [Cymbomonas tetramitiformis]
MVLIGALFACMLASAESMRSAWAPNASAVADAFIARVAAESDIPGIAVGVVAGGKVQYARGFGVQKSGDPNAAVTTNTLFQIGSCSKTFIAMGLAKYFDLDPSIGWNTRIKQIIPEFQMNNSYITETMVIGDLLAHRTGLGSHDGDLLWLAGDVTTEERLVLQRLRYLVPKERIGLKFQYSNIGYEVATVVLNRLAKEPWYEFIRKHLLLPLGMNDTLPGVPAIHSVSQKERLAFAHSYHVDPDPLLDEIYAMDLLKPRTPNLVGGISNGFLGAGSVISSTNDFCKWMEFLLNPGRSGIFKSQEGLIGVSVAEEAHVVVNHTLISAMLPEETVKSVGNAYGAGFGFDLVGALFGEPKKHFFSKGGDTLFHTTRTGFLPDEELAVVIFGNMEYGLKDQYLNALVSSVLEIFTGSNISKVEAKYAPVATKLAKIQSLIRSSPVVTYHLPLNESISNQSSATLSFPCGDFDCSAKLRDIDTLLPMLEVGGLGPPEVSELHTQRIANEFACGCPIQY